MQVASPLAHGPTLERLWRAARESRLPHALLFEGRDGIGKFLAARWFAMGCLCQHGPAEPCGSCGPCKRVASGGERGNHPDLFVIDPLLENEEKIRIARIAERERERGDGEQSLEAFLSLRPVEGRLRLALVREAQRMNEFAQNALLKTLEEPRPGTILLLETSRSSALLPTIHSRCIRVRFDALDAEQCQGVLLAAGLEAQAARELARLAEGSPGLALEMARNGTRALREILAGVALGERDALSASAELWQVEGEFGGKNDTARHRERARVVLDLAQGLLRDGWRACAGVPAERLAHGDLAPRLAARTGEHQLELRGAALLTARADIERNLTPAAVLERALLLLAAGPARRARPQQG